MASDKAGGPSMVDNPLRSVKHAKLNSHTQAEFADSMRFELETVRGQFAVLRECEMPGQGCWQSLARSARALTRLQCPFITHIAHGVLTACVPRQQDAAPSKSVCSSNRARLALAVLGIAGLCAAIAIALFVASSSSGPSIDVPDVRDNGAAFTQSWSSHTRSLVSPFARLHRRSLPSLLPRREVGPRVSGGARCTRQPVLMASGTCRRC